MSFINPYLDAVYTTVSGGRTHIAYGSEYQGSVNSYQCCLTRFFTKLFGIARDVWIDGKERTVNKKSFAKFTHGLDPTLDSSSVHSVDNTLLQPIHIRGLGPMNLHISQSKADRLTSLLIDALYSNNDSQIALFVGKGANVNKSFWERDHGYGITMGNYDSGLSNKPLKFKATNWTPSLLAYHNHVGADVKELMRRCGAILNLNAKEIKFRRKLVGANTNHTLHNDLQPHNHYATDYYGHTYYAGTTYTNNTYVVTHHHKTFKDTAKEIALLSIDPHSQSTVRSYISHPIVHKNTYTVTDSY